MVKEDLLLRQLVKNNGNHWTFMVEVIPGRNARQCRHRWVNYLKSNAKNTAWVPCEDATLLDVFAESLKPTLVSGAKKPRPLAWAPTGERKESCKSPDRQDTSPVSVMANLEPPWSTVFLHCGEENITR
jgi:hypothetical protein